MAIQREATFSLLFFGTTITSAGYGSTFLLNDHFRSLGGGEIDTGFTLLGAALGTFLGVPLVGWLSGRASAARIAAGASLSVAFGFWGLSLIDAVFPGGVACGAVIGIGWGAYFLAAPIALSERVDDTRRGFWFAWSGAFQMAGIGGGPVVATLLQSHWHVPTSVVFRAVAATCVLAAVALVAFDYVHPGRAVKGKRATNWIASLRPLSHTLAIYPIGMVMLGACVFTSVLTFQSSIAQIHGLDPSLFYAVYTVTVVGARMALAPLFGRIDPNVATVTLLIVMTAGVMTGSIQGASVTLYILGAVLLGIGYGLVYAVIQTLVVNDAPVEYRDAALTWFTLAYFVGVFGFPLIGGLVLVHVGLSGFYAVLVCLALLEVGLALIRRAAALRMARSRGGYQGAQT